MPVWIFAFLFWSLISLFGPNALAQFPSILISQYEEEGYEESYEEVEEEYEEDYDEEDMETAEDSPPRRFLRDREASSNHGDSRESGPRSSNTRFGKAQNGIVFKLVPPEQEKLDPQDKRNFYKKYKK